MNKTIEKRRRDWRTKGKTPRDSQRSKVYKAESDTSMRVNPNYCNDFPEIMTLQEIESWVEKIMTSKWFESNYPGVNQIIPAIRDGRGSRRAAANTRRMRFPIWTRFELMVLHELAHVVCAHIYRPYEIRMHGRAYCAVYLNLVKRWIGKPAHDELKKSFKKHGVKYGRSPATAHEPGPALLSNMFRF